MAVNDQTMRFEGNSRKEISVAEMLDHVYHALESKGYDPINQIIGYLLTEDPAYIPRQDNARQMIRQYDRDVIMEVILKNYLKNNGIDVK